MTHEDPLLRLFLYPPVEHPSFDQKQYLRPYLWGAYLISGLAATQGGSVGLLDTGTLVKVPGETRVVDFLICSVWDVQISWN